MALIKGICVVLFERTKTGTDGFGAALYQETAVTVENVLVTPVAAEEVVNELTLHGKRAEYELCIPKGDTHRWENCRVDFWGETWCTIGTAQQQIDANVPLRWNKKVRVERYG